MEKLYERCRNFLSRIIEIPSLSGKEEGMVSLCREAFEEYADSVMAVPFPSDIGENDYFSSVLPDNERSNGTNLEIFVSGTGKDVPLIINAHMDVVPAEPGSDQFKPRTENGIIYGRGACDDKGSIAAVYLMLWMLRNSGRKPNRDIIIHLVSEEETGGNGTLAILRTSKRTATLVINMEPTDLKVSLGHRGAVWFSVCCQGRAVHSGDDGVRENALLYACDVIQIMQDIHKSLRRSVGLPEIFSMYRDPEPLTFGKFQSGTWPAIVPSRATLEGVFGFLPPLTCAELRETITRRIQNDFRRMNQRLPEVTFPFNNEPYINAADNNFVKRFERSLLACGIEPRKYALNGCADLWHYHHVLGIPGIQFGPGSMQYAHTRDEQIALEDVEKAARVLFHFVTE